MYVRVLGPVSAESDGDPVAASANQRLLVALLASRHDRIVPADVLAEALWGEAPPRHPTASLQNLVSRLRARLGPDDVGCLVTRPPGYGLVLDHTSLDRLDFEHRVAQARGEPDRRSALDAYTSALRLWRGRPYAEFADLEAIREEALWLDEFGALVREERLTLLVAVDPAAAVAELEALVAGAPFRERGHALLMEALYRTRRQRDALRAFSAYRKMLIDEVGLDPSPAMQELEAAILNGTLDVAAPQPPDEIRTPLAPRRHNLPARRTSFVGRSGDVAAIAAHLEDERLVTLVGAGGAGKTSLAVEAARTVIDRFEHGVWIVDLVQIADGNHIAEHAATTMGLTAASTGDPMRSLVSQIAGHTSLVVLDNCEHVVAEAALLADALLDAPGIRVLATSREPLRVPGEVVRHVQPLGVPGETAGLSEVLESPSGRLFVDRVGAADMSFRLEHGDSGLIGTICRRLDGLPLAIELAAARVPSLGLPQVAGRLDDRFGLLTSGHRGGIAHHQTLRAAIAWSVDLLDERERVLLARLTVFAGGFDLEAAETVCADGRLGPERIPETLAYLVDRSLVAAQRSDGMVRYRLLETIREYASAELAGDDDATLRRHGEWCRRLAREAGDGFLVSTAEWYRRLRTEFPNLRAAFRWSMAQGDIGDALDLAASLRWAPFNTGHLYREVREWIESALARARTSGVGDEILARGLVSAGAVAGLETRSADAVELLTEAVDLLTELDASGEVVWCHMWLGAFEADRGHFEAAVDHTRIGLELAEAIGSTSGVVYLANQHGENAMAAARLLPSPGHAETARDAFAVAIGSATDHRIEEGLVRAEHGLALLGAVDDPEASLDACHRALEKWRRLGLGNRLILGLVCTARVAVRTGDTAQAVTLLDEAIDAMVKVGWRQPLGRLLETAAVCALMTGDRADAALFAGAASAQFPTPRWYVPIDEEQRFSAARADDPAGWDEGVATGRTLDEADVIALTRHLVSA